MPKSQYYTVELSYTQKFSYKCVVKAESAAAARSAVTNEFNNADLLYDKVTDTSPDTADLRIRFVAPGAKTRLKAEHRDLMIVGEDDDHDELF